MADEPKEGPQTLDLQDLTAQVHDDLQKALDDATWRGTSHVQTHEYIVRQKHPELYDAIQGFIATYGTPYKFRGYTYKYVRIGAYKYWSIPPVLNRERLDAPEASAPVEDTPDAG